jgi:hypothetical protein
MVAVKVAQMDRMSDSKKAVPSAVLKVVVMAAWKVQTSADLMVERTVV